MKKSKISEDLRNDPRYRQRIEKTKKEKLRKYEKEEAKREILEFKRFS